MPRAACGWEALSNDDHRALRVLTDHAIEDSSGRAMALLHAEAGIESRAAVRVAVMRLEALGLVVGHRNSSRTYRLSLTPAGKACIDERG